MSRAGGHACSTFRAACSSAESAAVRDSASAALMTAVSVAFAALSSCSCSRALLLPSGALTLGRCVCAWRGLTWLPASMQRYGVAHGRMQNFRLDVASTCMTREELYSSVYCSMIMLAHLISSWRPAAGQWPPGAPSPLWPGAAELSAVTQRTARHCLL